jgi:hypothetical protein
VDREVECFGDLDEAGEADAGVVGRFVALDRLLLEANALGELSLCEAAGNACPNESGRQLLDAGRLDKGCVVERVVLGELGLEVSERAA